MKSTFSRLALGLALAVGVTFVASALWAQDAGAQNPAPSAQQMSPQPQDAKSFAGKIVKEGDRFVLRDTINKVTYQLDNQDQLKQYEGKVVKVTGSLDSASNTIHVENIEPSA